MPATQKFTYSTGDRPLAGYTIKRGLGRGGFGEVYFALSDGGKEVALKMVKGDQAVELRGTNHCLNLKHPRLVHILDVREDADGDPWVVMEYVNGETLDKAIRRHPKGLPVEQVARWFSELCDAVGYLHDQGIAHRDLKPSNVFIEDGHVKLTDFSLCKSVSGSDRETLTQHVGTVHYMAPEIGNGNYGPSIDQYSAAVMLYELLTGELPFDGQSQREILMKHLTANPDLTKVPTAFRSVLKRGLAKEPGDRYPDIRTLAKAVTKAAEGGDVLEALPVKPPAAPRSQAKETIPAALPAPTPRPEPVLDAMPAPAGTRRRIADACGSLALAAVLAAPASGLWALMARPDHWTVVSILYFQTVAVTWVALAAGWAGRPKGDDSWGRRLAQMVAGVGVGLLTVWLTGWTPGGPNDTLMEPSVAAAYEKTAPLTAWDAWREFGGVAAGYVSFFGLALGAMRWWRLTDRSRTHRFTVLPVFLAAFWGALLLLVWPRPDWPSGAMAVVTAAVLAQWSAPWEPTTPRSPRPRRLRA